MKAAEYVTQLSTIPDRVLAASRELFPSVIPNLAVVVENRLRVIDLVCERSLRRLADRFYTFLGTKLAQMPGF